MHKVAAVEFGIACASSISSQCVSYLKCALTNGHAGRNGMRVNDEIRNYAILCPRHIFLCVCDSNGAFLPMPTGKLVPHLRYSD